MRNSDFERKIEKWKRESQDKLRDIDMGKERKLTHKKKSKARPI